MPLASIRTLVREDLEATDRFIISSLESNIPMVKEVIEYVLTCGGKRIRPLILLLSARALSHRDQKHIALAAVIELIHTATLLHDDVVDGSTPRRGTNCYFGVMTLACSCESLLYVPSDCCRCQNMKRFSIFLRATPYIC